VSDVNVLIVGSGMAGAGLARALTDLGSAEMQMVSAGGIQDSSVRPAWGDWSSRNTHYRPAPGVSGRIGGRSMAWYGVALPLPEEVLGSWPEHVRRLLPDAYGSVERRLEAWKGAPLDRPECPADVKLSGTLSGSGEPFRVVPTAAYWHTGPESSIWRAYSPMDQLLTKPAKGFTLVDSRRVLWVEERRGRGFAVVSSDELTRATHMTTAKKVVLAAGTLENTRIFAQSLERLAGTRTVEWPGLVSKIKQGILTRPAAWMLEEFRPGDLAYLVSEHPELHANLFLELRDDRSDRPYVDLWWFAEQSPGEDASITFKPEGPIWEGTVACEIGPTDLQLIAERDAIANRLLRDWHCPVADFRLPAFSAKSEAQAALSDGAVRYLNQVGLSDHESGTVKLGCHLDHKSMSVLVDQLYVMGPASFPRLGAVNPSLTILALADIYARLIAP
jgi:choline dehydrogenase-like flavoprotein